MTPLRCRSGADGAFTLIRQRAEPEPTLRLGFANLPAAPEDAVDRRHRARLDDLALRGRADYSDRR
jgi:hypothetical protein